MIYVMAFRILGIVLVVPPLVLVHDRIGWIYGTRGKSMAPVLNPQDTWYDRYVSDVVLVLRESFEHLLIHTFSCYLRENSPNLIIPNTICHSFM